MRNRIVLHIVFTIAALGLMCGSVSAKGIVDQEQWRYTGSHSLAIAPPNGYIIFDQAVTAGVTGLLTNVEFYADVTSDRVYFFVNQSGRHNGPALGATFVTKLAKGSGLYNTDVSAAKIFLKAGDVFSIGLIGGEGDTPAGSFRAAINANPKAYAGALYYRYGGTGWLGLGYDDDMMFRTYVTPLDQEQWTDNGSHNLAIAPPNGHIVFDQSVTAGVTGLLTNVEFYADVTSDRVYFFVNQSGRNNGPALEATFVTKLAKGSGVYNVDVSAAKIYLKDGDVFSIGLVGGEGDTSAGSFRAAIDANPKAYAGALYYRYGGTGWLGLGYNDDMMFRTYVTPLELGCFPQVAIGGGITTTLILLNNGAETTTGSLTLTDQLGNPLSASLTESGMQLQTLGAGEVPVSIAPGATLFLKADAFNPSDPTKVGWAHLESHGGSLGAVATYEITEGGALKTTVGVLASQPVGAATIPVNNDATRDRRTAFAVANYGGEDINIRIVVVDKNGTVINTITAPELNPLGPQKQVARYLDEYDGSKRNFQGSMVLIVEAGKRFVVTALVQNQGLYTSIPVIPGKASNIPD
ncbi:MAG: hypothetical protein LAP85_29660 [Acidobacteriia bacterium]|nr:hypothetical protein [Terriglobia bacterium]